VSLPSQVYLRGIGSPLAKAVLVSSKGGCVAVGMGVGLGVGLSVGVIIGVGLGVGLDVGVSVGVGVTGVGVASFPPPPQAIAGVSSRAKTTSKITDLAFIQPLLWLKSAGMDGTRVLFYRVLSLK